MGLLNGVVFGALFGFFLQRAHILRFEKQINMLRLKDMTVLKFMLTAALVGMVTYQIFESSLLITLPSRPVYVAPMLIGGIIFGLGWAIIGYCPGTQLGAIGEGRWDGVWAMLGAIVGSTAYFYLYPLCESTLFKIGAYQSLDLDTALGWSPWVVIALLGVGFATLCWWLEQRKL